MTGGDELTFLARKRRIVYRESHFYRGFGNLYELMGFGAGKRADRVADINLFKTAKTYDIACLSFFNGYSFKTFNLIEIYDFTLLFKGRVIIVGHHNGRTCFNRAPFYAPDTYSADEVVVVD